MDDVAELRNEAASTPEHEVWARGGPVFARRSEDTVHGLYCASRGMLPANAPVGSMQGILFEVFAYLSLTLMIGAFKLNAALVLTLACTAIGFGLAGVAVLVHPANGFWDEIGRIGGDFMIASAAFAFYGGSAIIVNTAWRRTLVPIGGQI